MAKMIWTPDVYGSYDFGIDLDWDFAQKMIQTKIPAERQAGMNRLADDELTRFGINWINPYHFHNDSCFVSQFNLGSGGVWLSTNYQAIDRLVKGDRSFGSVRYDSHNVDRSDHFYALMFIFDKWVGYADILREG